MARQTKAQQAERAEAIERLREWIKPGDTVYTILDHVSASGMSRDIRVVIPQADADGKIDFIHPNHAIQVALGLRRASKGDGVRVGGCGMDMGFHLVYELSHVLYGAGYQCLGKGKCPSPYHVNYRSRVRCEGINHDGIRKHCHICKIYRDPSAELPTWKQHRETAFHATEDMRAAIDWTRQHEDLAEAIELPYVYRAVIFDGDGENLRICPTCEGRGDFPNPEGPERFDLVHQDGYAVRQRWL